MKKSISGQCLGVLALLCSSVGFAATVTVTASTLNPLPGSTFSVLVSGTDFPNTAAADLNLTFDSAVVSVDTPTLSNGIVLAPGSPFTNGVIADNPFVSGNANGIQVLAGFVITPSGTFDAILINFTVNAGALAGALANIVVSDRDGWTNADTFEQIPVTYNNPNVVVGGVVVPPNIVVTDSIAPNDNQLLNFGSVTVGANSSATVTVTNDGGSNLVLGGPISLAAGAFSITSDFCSSATLNPAGSCIITVAFSPVAAQAYSGSFDITSNDPDTATVTVSLSGTGTAAPVPDITVTDSVAPNSDLSVPYGDVDVGSMVTETVTVTNNGSATLNLSAVGALAAPFSIVTDTCVGQNLAPPVACTITVR
ncbi:MAG: choice-of-anchor D domain-containing protein, partial [Gammaproteobacteria bacterium]|nr:choice-of-anchor D domain-containing protein [Gammaproteobacteria bacterium]